MNFREQVAKALYEYPGPEDDPEWLGQVEWPPTHRDDREWWLSRADAVLPFIEGPSCETKELLKPEEHRAVEMAGELFNLICEIAGDDISRPGDLAEMMSAIHVVQRAILKQAAARAYPEKYRLLGGTVLDSPNDNDQKEVPNDY